MLITIDINNEAFYVQDNKITIETDILTIGIKGYSVATDDNGECIVLDANNGKPQLVVWSDINEQDPTHTISLEGAREVKRIKDKFDPAIYIEDVSKLPIAEARLAHDEIIGMSHGDTCAMRIHSMSPCTCGKADYIIKLEERIDGKR